MRIIFQIYSKNHVLAVKFVPPQIAGGGKIKGTTLISTMPLSLYVYSLSDILYNEY